MNQSELKEKIYQIIDQHKIGVLATVENNKPYSRYMTFSHDNFTLYTPTNKETDKTEEIENNPNVHILLGYEGVGDTYVEMVGTASVLEDKQVKENMWDVGMERWFEGPDDPEYVVLKIDPETIRLMNKRGEQPQSVDFH